MQIAALDLIIIVAYLLLIASVGFFSKKKVNDPNDYFVAGRSLPTFVLMATICASVVGGSALIGKGGYAYTGGVVCIAIGLPYMVGMFIFSAFSGKIAGIGVVLNGVFCVAVSLLTYKKYPSKTVTL